ncbi:MAG: dienelactone hydrolase family protein [Solirubrobacteraceae bacterium]
MPDSRHVLIETAGAGLPGDIAIPEDAVGVVVFAHGSGSGRHSPRNRQVALGLRERRLATLLLDLLTEDEERLDLRTRELRFDVGLLGRRLIGAVEWLEHEPETAALPVGCFGASTGAAAALTAAALLPDRVRAVVSRGGRPDLAGESLESVDAPTLLIVGGADPVVLDLNRQAQGHLRCANRLEVVPGASHLFEEPGTLEVVTELAGEWFVDHLGGKA